MTEQPHYKLNVDKIKTIEDVKNVFELLDLGFYLPATQVQLFELACQLASLVRCLCTLT